MLVIRKQNFDSQPCYCCTGKRTNTSDPNYATTYVLYHKLPDSLHHLEARVIVPRCKYCAQKMLPIFYFAIGASTIAAIGGFLYTFCDHGIILSLLTAVFWGGIGFVACLKILGYAFGIVYNQSESDYQIVNVLKMKFGWQTTQPKQGEKDEFFSDFALKNMLDRLENEYGCEIGTEN